VLLPRNGRVLLTFQGDPHFEYQLPGGGIDPGEHVLPALHREVLEETGWKIAAPRRIGCFRRFVYMPEYDMMAEKVCHIFLGRPVRRISEPTEPDHRPVWMPASEAASLVGNPIDATVLKWL
jgi:8-oxo-dGTP diphosphatase